jgi:uncharacterized protein (TIGR02145 family)
MDTLIRPRQEESYRIKNLFLLLLSFALFFHLGNAQPLTGGVNRILSIDTMIVEAGWNLLSLPLVVTDGVKSSLFPSAASDAFLYRNEYIAEDTLANGYGFWMKFNTAENIVITGDTILYDGIEVQPGWNIIGSLTAPVVVTAIKSNPIGIIVSDFFYYSSGAGYQSADTIRPGFGYWVKVNQEGSIILDAATGGPCPGVPTVDYESKIYNTVQIGSQCWMKENLDVGIMINGTQQSADNSTIEKYCFNDIPANCDIYGGFYQWNEVMKYSLTAATQGICPPGWHLPTYAEIETLVTAVNYDGNALKAVGQGSEEGAGTNTSGFSALLSGIRDYSGGFSYPDSTAYFWSSTGGIYGGFYKGYNFFLWYSAINIYLYFEASEYGFNVRCIWHGGAANRPPSVPEVPTPENQAIEQPTFLEMSWTCSDIEGDPITYDIYLGTDNPPATKVTSDLTGEYLSMGGLDENTTYYWKVVAKDDHDNSTAGPVWSFSTGFWGTPCEGIPTVEYAGKTYHTVQVGSQCWLKENLDVGTMINVSSNQANNSITEKYCYDNDSMKCKIYGGYYQWDEVMQYSVTEGAQGICPTGWHVPTYAEFQTCSTTVSGDGNALKVLGVGSWYGEGTNTSGFSAVIAGDGYNGVFENLYTLTSFWSSTRGPEPYADYPYDFSLYYDYSDISIGYHDKLYGFSVRCVKN